MPYPRSEPASIEKITAPATDEEMEFARWKGHHSICQMLRDIYALSDNEEVKLKSRIAFTMAKKMNDRLQYYKRKELNDNK